MSTVMEAIIKGMSCLAMAATIETTILNMTWVAAAAAHLDLKSVQEKATQAICMGTADMYASKLELGEARFEIANHIDQSGRFSQTAIQVPMFQNHDTATITQTKALVYSSHSDIEAVGHPCRCNTLGRRKGIRARHMDAALRQFKNTAIHSYCVPLETLEDWVAKCSAERPPANLGLGLEMFLELYAFLPIIQPRIALLGAPGCATI